MNLTFQTIISLPELISEPRVLILSIKQTIFHFCLLCFLFIFLFHLLVLQTLHHLQALTSEIFESLA